MYRCNSCGKKFNDYYENCPHCGLNGLVKIEQKEQTIIKTPPADGYNINLEDFNHTLSASKTLLIGGIIPLIIAFLFLIPSIIIEIGFSSGGPKTMYVIYISEIIVTLILLAVGILLIWGSVSNKKETKKNIEKVKELSKKGYLIKGLQYEFIGIEKDDKYTPPYCLRVEYEKENGEFITLTSNTKYNETTKEEKTVDLLIDPNDDTNYYIDFEIK